MKQQVNKKFDIRKFSIILLLGLGILFIIIGLTPSGESNSSQTVTCEFKPVYTNYKETLKFVYKNKKMYEYYRTETTTTADDVDKTLDEIYEVYVDNGKTLNKNDDFSYTVEKTENSVIANLFINVNKYATQFDDYAYNLYITHELTANELKAALDATNYNCTIENN